MAVVELPRTPSLPALYGRAAAGLLPRRGRGSDAAPVGELPDTELLVRGVGVDRGRLAEYVRVCGFRLTDTLPPTYPHILAFPLALALLTAPGFPFPAAGMVHVANRIEHRRPLPAAIPLDLAVHAEALRPHPRGYQVDLVADASVDGQQVWRGVSTYLHRSRAQSRDRKSDPGPGAAAEDRPEPSAASGRSGAEPSAASGRSGPEPAVTRSEPGGTPPRSAVWRVGAETGPAYAAVSGDRNPIHLSSLAARAFGFRRRIAHGMWTKARCLAQLAPRLPATYVVEVTFQAPVLLPATLGFSATPGVGPDPAWSFALHGVPSGRPHLAGTVG